MSVTIVPCFLGEAQEFVANFHRHNAAPRGGVFAVGASDGDDLVGVAIVGRPIARLMQDGGTLEVTRCCVRDGAPKGSNSALYATSWRACKALGWRRLITYTLQAESGASLRGAGWRIIGELAARDPAQWQNRPGREWQAVVGQAKLLWQAAA